MYGFGEAGKVLVLGYYTVPYSVLLEHSDGRAACMCAELNVWRFHTNALTSRKVLGPLVTSIE